MPERLHFYLIAGEQSGDLLGARLMRALKALVPDALFSGIGGTQMEAEGLQSRLPISELAMMGFVEIAPHIPRLLRHIRETSHDIITKKPDAVITIDSPGFCLRVTKQCRTHWPKNTPDAPAFIHYVAPSVWAYKPGRARKLAKLYDHVLTLLPFEPPYFVNEGMGATFVGHPLVETPLPETAKDGTVFRSHHHIPADAPLLAVLPGSRMGELQRHLPILRESVALLREALPKLVTLMPVVPHLQETIHSMTTAWPTRLVIINESQEKWEAFAAADAAIAKSGTVTLELAMADTPMVVMYKVHWLSGWLMRCMIRTPYVTLANILEQEGVIPELLQSQSTPERIAKETLHLLKTPSARSKQHKAAASALRKLGMGEETYPSEKAAKAILQVTRKRGTVPHY